MFVTFYDCIILSSHERIRCCYTLADSIIAVIATLRWFFSGQVGLSDLPF